MNPGTQPPPVVLLLQLHDPPFTCDPQPRQFSVCACSHDQDILGSQCSQTAEKAILVSNQHQQQIDLLLTDVVLTGASGPKLAGQIGRSAPRSKFCYMSGYTDEAIFRYQVLDPGVAFIQKPFTPESLTRKTREVLAGLLD